MKTDKLLYDLHTEHQQWLNNLSFFEDEIKVFKNRIAEVASKNTNKEILAFVEHFQNQFFVQQDNIDRLKHDIKLDDRTLELKLEKNQIAADKQHLPDHKAFREKFEGFEHNFNELRKELYKFLSKTM